MPWQRIITALVLFLLAVFAIFFLPLERFSLLVAVIVLIGCWEWSGFISHRTLKNRLAYVVSSALLMWLVYKNSLPLEYWHAWMFPVELSDWMQIKNAALISLILGSIWWVFACVLVFLYPKVSRSFVQNMPIMWCIGWLLLIPTWVAITGLRSISIYLDFFRGSELLLFSLCLVWATDTGAFLVGKLCGKHKLAPQISPKKTWEGILGGAMFAALVALAGVKLLAIPDSMLSGLVILTIVIVFFSVIGDLTESIFKRLSGVKDSGQILPGHGGILDRIDALTAAMPIAALGFTIIGLN